MTELIFSPTDFVAITNQVFERSMPVVTIEGELSNMRVSKGKWVYFDLKDDLASVKFFGTVYALPGPLEDGMRLKVVGRPQLHQLYGFSITVQQISLRGEGTIKKAFDLLFTKLQAEGLFEPERKRELPYPPSRIGLITSGESAAYADFVKIINERWGGVDIVHADTQVQGEPAVRQIVAAIEWFNMQAELPDVLVITRGGGSADDLAVFNTEQIARAVAASRIPTLVAIGHEVDVSLAELAADQRASTPSNAAQLLVPDKRHELQTLRSYRASLESSVTTLLTSAKEKLSESRTLMLASLERSVKTAQQLLGEEVRVLSLLNPKVVLSRGYALIKKQGKLIRSASELREKDNIDLELSDGYATAVVRRVSRS